MYLSIDDGFIFVEWHLQHTDALEELLHGRKSLLSAQPRQNAIPPFDGLLLHSIELYHSRIFLFSGKTEVKSHSDQVIIIIAELNNRINLIVIKI
jgi:hypothetical protein